jgi:iron complex transport system ATP-binding protein
MKIEFIDLTVRNFLSFGNQSQKITFTPGVNIITGANGVGKSTLLRTITGIQKPLLGTIVLNQKEIQNYKPLELAHNLSLVLTEKLPTSNLTVFELIALGRQPYTNWIGNLSDNDIEKVNESIRLTQIEHLIHKKHFEISDGQFQKVLIARALAQDTPLIILDEPTTHLDLVHKVSVFKLLKKLTQETNKCILFSTHDIDLAIQLSDEMIVMTDETVIQDEPCNLISKGIFDLLFKDENITFDPNFGKFIIK